MSAGARQVAVGLTAQITTIIVTYRRPRMLERAIRSVLGQSYPHFKVCIYDDASGDETREVVMTLAAQDPRVEYICQPTNLGLVANANFAIERVTTPYFNILCDDDMLLPDFFEQTVAGLEEHVDAAFSARAVVCTEGQEGREEIAFVGLQNWRRDGYFGIPHEPPAKSIWHYPLWMAALYRRTVLDEIGLLDPEIFLVDVDFMLRICTRFPFVVSKTPGAIYVGHEGSSFQRAEFAPVWSSMGRIEHKLMTDVRIPPTVRSRLWPLIGSSNKWFLIGLAVKWLRQGRFDDAWTAANVLWTRFRSPLSAALVGSAAWTCNKVPPAHFAYRAVDALVRAFDRRFGRRARLRTRFGELLKGL